MLGYLETLSPRTLFQDENTLPQYLGSPNKILSLFRTIEKKGAVNRGLEKTNSRVRTCSSKKLGETMGVLSPFVKNVMDGTRDPRGQKSLARVKK